MLCRPKDDETLKDLGHPLHVTGTFYVKHRDPIVTNTVVLQSAPRKRPSMVRKGLVHDLVTALLSVQARHWSCLHCPKLDVTASNSGARHRRCKMARSTFISLL